MAPHPTARSRELAIENFGAMRRCEGNRKLDTEAPTREGEFAIALAPVLRRLFAVASVVSLLLCIAASIAFALTKNTCAPRL